MKGIAKFKPGQAKIYRDWFVNNIEEIANRAEAIRQSCFDSNGYRIKEKDYISNYIVNFQSNYLGKSWPSGNKIHPDYFLKAYDKIIDYFETFGGNFKLIDEFDTWIVVQYGKACIILFDHNRYLEIEYEKDLSNIKLNELKKISAIENETPMSLIIPGSNTSVNDLKKVENTINGKMDMLMANMEKVKKAEEGVLAEAKNEIDSLIKVIEEKKAELERKKSDMLLELNKKKAELDAQLFDMKKKITILEDTIYTIRCYLGETIELFQIRDGRPAKKDNPLVVFQKMRYLDDDLAKLISIYDVDGDNYKMVEKMLKYNDTAFEYFCPSEKCIVFMKVARDNRTFYQEPGHNMLDEYQYLHGDKIGFLIRNGERLFCGWTEEEKIKLHEDVFLKAGFSQKEAVSGEYDIVDGETLTIANTSYAVSSSRVFIFATLQGILENSNVLELPETVSVFRPSPYLVYSYADSWLVERKFGNFDNLVKNLNRLTKEDDMLLVIQNLYEPDKKSYGGERGRANSYRNRTYDCKVKDGLNRLNLIDDYGNYYISVEKDSYRSHWDDTPAVRSNFRVYENEFINITYFNSEWLRYYITNQEIGNRKVTFAHFARYLKIALDYVKSREQNEKSLILEHYPELERIKDWMVVLSHWKIMKKVRSITEFQAKRFARYLNEDKIKFIKNLFMNIDKPGNPVLKYHLTNIEGVYNQTWHSGHIECGWQDNEFGYAGWEDRDSGREKYNRIKSSMTPDEIRVRLDTYEKKKLSKMLDEVNPLLVALFYEEVEKEFQEQANKKDEFLKNHYLKEYEKFKAFINTKLHPNDFCDNFTAMLMSNDSNNPNSKFAEIIYILEVIQIYRIIVQIAIDKQFDEMMSKTEEKNRNDP